MEPADFLIIAIGFLLSLGMTKLTITRELFLKITSIDLHKEKPVKVPKVGGMAIAIAFSIAMVIAFLLKGSIVFPVILLSFLVSAVFGLLDDMLPLEPWRKMVLASFGAVPLLFLISLDPWSVIFLFGAVAVASNWTNMLAGFNGLEAGLGAIMFFFLALNTNSPNTAIVLYSYAAVLFGFLFFNKYPAKIFPGNSGTMPVGVVLVGATLIGAPFFKLAILFIPHFIDALLKFTSAGIISGPTLGPSRLEKGFLKPGKGYLSLSKVIMKYKPITEWKLVGSIWALEIALGLVTLMI